MPKPNRYSRRDRTQKIKRLSYSSVNLYNTCARAWRYRYIQKVQTPTSGNLVIGSAVHGAIENYIAERADDAKNKKHLVDYWAGAWAEQLADKRNATIDYGDETPESLDATGARMLKNKDVIAAIDSIIPMTGMPFQVWSGESTGPMIERKVTLNVPGVPIPVIGYTDITASDGVPIDLKTAGRMWPKGKEHKESQPNVYLAAFNQMGWTLNPERKFRYVIITKGKVPRVAVRETTRTMGELFWTLNLIKETWDAIQAGVFPPSGVGSWKCDPRYCEFFSLCKGG